MKNVVAFTLSLHMILFSIALSWLLLYQLHFLYGVFHEVGGIKQGIEKYAPLNTYKVGFEDTTYMQRVDIFEQISYEVHNSGKGLSSITYQTPSSNGPQYVLRDPEVVHLQDVANVLDFFKPLFWWSLLALPAMVLLLIRVKSVYRFMRVPTIKQGIITVGILGVLIVLPLVIFGAENVFNQLHIWVFPKEHQWFFYYQESLMSTLMYAPYLFAWIAAAWAVFALCAFLLAQFILYKGDDFAKKVHNDTD